MTMTMRARTSTLEHKTLFGGETKIIDAEQGIVEAIISVTGIVDEVKDVIEPGAYEKTLQVRLAKGVRTHDWDRPAAKALEMRELLPLDPDLPTLTSRGEPWPREAGALKVRMVYNLETVDGREGFSNVKFFGSEQEWSVGYNVPRGGSRTDQKTGIRHIQVMDLFEFSDVLFGAMPLAGTTGVKGLFVTEDGIEVKALAGSFEARQEALEDACNAAFREEYPPTDGNDGMMSGGWQSIRATFSDHVIVCFRHDDERQDWSYQYTYDGDDAVLGERTPVRIEESVVPDDQPYESPDALVLLTSETAGKGSPAMVQGEDETDDSYAARVAAKTAEDAAALEAKTLEDAVEPLTPAEVTEFEALRAYVS